MRDPRLLCRTWSSTTSWPSALLLLWTSQKVLPPRSPQLDSPTSCFLSLKCKAPNRFGWRLKQQQHFCYLKWISLYIWLCQNPDFFLRDPPWKRKQWRERGKILAAWITGKEGFPHKLLFLEAAKTSLQRVREDEKKRNWHSGIGGLSFLPPHAVRTPKNVLLHFPAC